MDSINYRVYPLANITLKIWDLVASKLKVLEGKTSTKISYNFEEQYFDISASNHENCVQAETIICGSLLPRLNDRIDMNYIEGVFSELDIDHPTPNRLKNKHIPDQNALTAIGRTEEPDEYASENITDTSSSEEETDEEDKNKQIVVKVFHISPAIKNPASFFTGPVAQNMQPIDYLKEIPLIYDVTCERNGRDIQIVGVESAVESAHNAFAVIQRTALGQSRTIRVPCIHYPGKSDHYGLYFCKLSNYRYNSMVQTHLNKEEYDEIHVILPAFIDRSTDEYKRPKDLLSDTVINQRQKTYHAKASHQLNAIMDQVVSQNGMIETSWGLDRAFVNSYQSEDLEYLSQKRLASAFTPVPQQAASTNPNYMNNFPSLPTPTHVVQREEPPQQNKMRRRVMRIVSQRSAPIPRSNRTSSLERVKTYNYQNIKKALTTGLESVRGFKGEIKLSARLGKVLWPTQDTAVSSRIWEIEEIIDIVVRELGTIPKFTTATTMDRDIIDCITSEDVIPQNYYSKTAIFEFNCQARNQPSSPYKPIVLYMNQGVVKVDRVVASEKNVVEIDWVNLDRKFDFQLTLQTQELLRCDVKPFSSFIKWVSICPITQLMSFENMPNFLEVKSITFKQTTKFRVVYPYVVEIVRVENVPLRPVPNTNKINALVGKGEFWYDFKLYNILHNSSFQSNLDLGVAQEATWTVDEILNPESSDVITEYVRNMLIIIENIELAVKKYANVVN